DLIGYQCVDAVLRDLEIRVERIETTRARDELRGGTGRPVAFAVVRRGQYGLIRLKRREADVLDLRIGPPVRRVELPRPVGEAELSAQAESDLIELRRVGRSARREIAELLVQLPTGVRSALRERISRVRIDLHDVVRPGLRVELSTRGVRVDQHVVVAGRQ